MRARVVLPEPGGPQKMHDPTSPRRISSPRGFSGPGRGSWPRISSTVVGRMRAARGSPPPRLPLPWKSVGSDTGNGKGERGNVLRENASGSQHTDTEQSMSPCYLAAMRQLEQLDAWRVAQELAEAAYRLTMTSPL